MDRFLDSHSDIDRQLDANPSLINNKDFLRDHPDLQAYLTQHPRVTDELTENPNYFMRRENRFENSGADRDGGRRTDGDRDADRRTDPDRRSDADRDAGRDRNPNPDLNETEVATMDQFLDDHKDIAKELERKPSLIQDSKYVNHHKELKEFLGQHPQVREEFAENPSNFMHRENRFEARDSDRPDANNPNRDLTNGEVKEMDEFLDKHQKIAKDLDKNPSLVNDDKYLKHHKDLGAFMDQKPEMREELKENPSYFMHRQERLERHEGEMHGQPAQAKAKTPIEKHEDTDADRPH